MGELAYYLDHAAATPCDTRVFSAMQPYISDVFYNPSSSYEGGRQAKRALEKARSDVAEVLGAKADEVIFTAGTTESVYIALRGVLDVGGHAVIGALEHAAVREAVASYSHTLVKVDERGMLDASMLENSITDGTVVVSVAYADSEFGVVQDMSKISHVVENVRRSRADRGVKTPLYFHSDASQAATALDIKVARLGVDLLTLNAAKCYGPKQTGVLWVKSSVKLRPMMQGGGQERGLRGGTEDVSRAVGFAKALQLAQAERTNENERLRHMKQKLESVLLEHVDGIVIDGHKKRNLPGHLHFHVDGLDAERVVFHLDNKQVYIATGAACAANKNTRSPALEAFGLSASEADGSLRISLGKLNKAEDIPRIADLLIEAIETERRL